MPLIGEIQIVSFPDLLQLLASLRKTGSLLLEQDRRWVKFQLWQGEVVAFSGSEPAHFVGNALVGLGKLAADTLAEALAREKREGRYFGELLVEEGRLERAVLDRYLSDTALAVAAELCQWSSGSFRFDEFAPPEGTPSPVRLSAESLLLEGLRQVDETARMRESVPTDAMLLERGPAAAPSDGGSVEVAVIKRLDRPRSVRELKDTLKAGDYKLLSGLTGLIEKGIVRRVKPRDVPPPAEGWQAEARQLLREHKFEAAMTLLHAVRARDPGVLEAQPLLELAEARFLEVARTQLPAATILELRSPLDRLPAGKLSASEAFVAGRIDGRKRVGDLLREVPLREAEVHATLLRLIAARVVQRRA